MGTMCIFQKHPCFYLYHNNTASPLQNSLSIFSLLISLAIKLFLSRIMNFGRLAFSITPVFLRSTPTGASFITIRSTVSSRTFSRASEMIPEIPANTPRVYGRNQSVPMETVAPFLQKNLKGTMSSLAVNSGSVPSKMEGESSAVTLNRANPIPLVGSRPSQLANWWRGPLGRVVKWRQGVFGRSVSCTVNFARVAP